jgi:hypothetical protein
MGGRIRASRHLLVGAVAAVSLLAGVPAAADATTLYVSETPSGADTSCAHAGFKEIQTAIDEAETLPGSTVDICSGTYREQLEITGEVTLVGKGHSKVTLPAAIGDSNTTCDKEIDALGGQPDEDLVSICGEATVKVSTLTLEAKWPADTCDDSLYNTMVGGGATLDATRVTFAGAGVDGSGCQGGVGLEVGVSGLEGSASVSTPALEVGHAVLTHDTFTEYQKNGVTVDGAGSSATVGPAVTITGAGPSPQGQNGIQISRGAVASIDKATISDNNCNIPTVCGHANASQWEEDASGVLLYLPGAKATVESSRLSDNNIGVEYISGRETRPAEPELNLTADTIEGGYASVQINQGNAALSRDKLSGGLIAIDVNENEYGGGFGTLMAYAPDATSANDHLEGSQASVQVEASVGALAGELSLSGDSIVGPVEDHGHSKFLVTG